MQRLLGLWWPFSWLWDCHLEEWAHLSWKYCYSFQQSFTGHVTAIQPAVLLSCYSLVKYRSTCGCGLIRFWWHFSHCSKWLNFCNKFLQIDDYTSPRCIIVMLVKINQIIYAGVTIKLTLWFFFILCYAFILYWQLHFYGFFFFFFTKKCFELLLHCITIAFLFKAAMLFYAFNDLYFMWVRSVLWFFMFF